MGMGSIPRAVRGLSALVPSVTQPGSSTLWTSVLGCHFVRRKFCYCCIHRMGHLTLLV